MARYIDLDIAIKAAAMAVCDQFTAVDVVTALEEAPTADVAPRADFDKAIKNFLDAQDKVISEAKTEVAREIFEEIEKIINEPFAVGFDLLSPLNKALCDYNNGIRKDLLYYISELKKKYLEGRND